ncbi:hypothetical protein [Planobispora takensis]|uniref:LigA protein n=1 Tax=Planobispora takensis TaxID=1367882 RepID=A0A8J3WYG6_9ACTN|nr:hypothetical protein [Planobispora takensis]GII05933.1 hypothetical protein Pta02_79410 [Planobispora takensis]
MTQLIDDDARMGALRTTAVVVAAAGTLPYITLKVTWLTGGRLGINDPSLTSDGGFFGLNLLTLGMDAVALLVALAFLRPWGRRIPAGLVLLPMWVGIGLLAPLPLLAPLSALAAALEKGAVVPAGAPVAGWVYLVVYTGFICQGIGLTAGFLHHARHRWPTVFEARTSDGAAGAAGPARELQTFVAWGAVAVAAVLAVIDLGWSLGAEYGLTAEMIAQRGFGARMQDAVNAVLAVAAAAGLLTVVRRRSDRPLWVPVAVAWVGSGGMFGWSLWSMIVTLTPNPLSPRGDQGIVGLVVLFTLLTGAVVGLAGVFTLAERLSAGVRDGVWDGVRPR